MHRLILDAPDDKEVDHINWKRYDNRKENLRVCTHQENMMNCPSRQNYSGITGVVWDENRKLWTARITVEKKNKYLGRFEDKDEAIKTRLEAEAKYYLPQMFGQNHYQILTTPVELLQSLVKLYEKIKHQKSLVST